MLCGWFIGFDNCELLMQFIRDNDFCLFYLHLVGVLVEHRKQKSIQELVHPENYIFFIKF